MQDLNDKQLLMWGLARLLKKLVPEETSVYEALDKRINEIGIELNPPPLPERKLTGW